LQAGVIATVGEYANGCLLRTGQYVAAMQPRRQDRREEYEDGSGFEPDWK